ncbi:maleylacetoacetate isomerase [Sphingobium lactosutens]|uniref:Maleylacetoacetate isomerase n=1 Tax=Sphingobium lactosutens DS20 TaxID=1331060 RepID=T0HIG1_9SPHN|nr:maleylacetoacetate isomerase [Sphingobium lactosutens]EQB12797.1 maleylacetoacetate isomerase [Sphingobium lactosutens DS20]
MSDILLHGYYRSTASYRVRIALNLKGLPYRQQSHHLRKGEQKAPAYRALNPQAMVPALEIDGAVLTQSLAICDYLDERQPDPPLLPSDPILRAKVRAFAQVIACDIHPIQNLRILDRLRDAGLDNTAVKLWAATVIEDGFDACAAMIADQPGPYCFGSQVTLADLFLVPQLVNARRFGADLRWPRLLDIERACLALPAFADAAPECQPDAE